MTDIFQGEYASTDLFTKACLKIWGSIRQVLNSMSKWVGDLDYGFVYELNSYEPQCQTLQWRRKSLVSSCCLRSTAGLVRETWRGRGQPGGGFWYEYSSANPGGVEGVLEWHWAKQPVGGPWTHSSTWGPGAHTTTCDWWKILRKPVIGGKC